MIALEVSKDALMIIDASNNKLKRAELSSLML